MIKTRTVVTKRKPVTAVGGMIGDRTIISIEELNGYGGQLWEECEKCGREPVYTSTGYCERCVKPSPEYHITISWYEYNDEDGYG